MHSFASSMRSFNEQTSIIQYAAWACPGLPNKAIRPFVSYKGTAQGILSNTQERKYLEVFGVGW